MKKWILLLALISPSIARANTVTPSFTTGSMQSTTTTQQTITEEIVHEIEGSASESYSGTNITITGAGGIGHADTVYTPTSNATDWDTPDHNQRRWYYRNHNNRSGNRNRFNSSSYSIFSQ